MSTAIGILAVSLIAVVSSAQEIGYLDLTNSVPRPRHRAPTGFSGGCGGIGGEHLPRATVTLLNLDKRSYSVGQEVTFEVEIRNSGQDTIYVPWTPNLSDLEPADPALSYSYDRGSFLLELSDLDSRRSVSIFTEAYGSPDVPGTLRELRPGQWFLFRGRKKLEVYDTWVWEKLERSGLLNLQASANFMVSKVEYLPKGKDGVPTETSWCGKLSAEKVNRLPVRLVRYPQ